MDPSRGSFLQGNVSLARCDLNQTISSGDVNPLAVRQNSLTMNMGRCDLITVIRAGRMPACSCS